MYSFILNEKKRYKREKMEYNTLFFEFYERYKGEKWNIIPYFFYLMKNIRMKNGI